MSLDLIGIHVYRQNFPPNCFQSFTIREHIILELSLQFLLTKA